jgi:cytochrome c oxidase subunit 3
MTESQSDAAPLRLEIQFEDIRQQHHAAHFGVWLFIASELLFFTGLFALYVGYRSEYPAEFAAAARHAVLWIGTVNTSLLIISSFTVLVGLDAMRAGNIRTCIALLGVSIALATAFLVLKGVEWGLHASDGALPGKYYAFAELPSHGAQLFFTLYYFMTGLHVLHLVGAVVAMAWMIRRIRRGLTTPRYHVELEGTALYWHFVDCIWIFLYPLFYLLD